MINADTYPFDLYAEISALFQKPYQFTKPGPLPDQLEFQVGVKTGTDSISIIAEQVRDAFLYARSLKQSVMHFRTDGVIAVWPVQNEPELHELQYLVGGHIESLYTPALGDEYTSGYIGYANDDGLGVLPPNLLMPYCIDHPEDYFCGPGVLLVGFRIDEHGETVPYVPDHWSPD